MVCSRGGERRPPMAARGSELRYPIPQTGESARADQTGLFWKVLRCSAPIKGDKGRSAQLIGAENAEPSRTRGAKLNPKFPPPSYKRVRKPRGKERTYLSVYIFFVQESSEAKGEREDLSLGSENCSAHCEYDGRRTRRGRFPEARKKFRSVVSTMDGGRDGGDFLRRGRSFGAL